MDSTEKLLLVAAAGFAGWYVYNNGIPGLLAPIAVAPAVPGPGPVRLLPDLSPPAVSPAAAPSTVVSPAQAPGVLVPVPAGVSAESILQPGQSIISTANGTFIVTDPAAAVAQAPATTSPPVVTANPMLVNSPGLAKVKPSVSLPSGIGIVTGIGLVDPLYLLGALGAVEVIESKKGFDFTTLILPGVIIIGGYLLITNIGKLLPANASTPNNASVVASQSAVAATLKTTIAAGTTPTISSAQATASANAIWATGESANPLSDSQMQSVMWDTINNVNNLADLLMIIQAFGTKQVSSSSPNYSFCSLLGINCPAVDLPGYLNLILNSDYLGQINSFLSSTNIAYQF
jgi:hypothetical protein